MTNKVIISLLSLCSLTLIGMGVHDQEKLASWVKKANEIVVETAELGYVVPITGETSIGDIKEIIMEYKGVSPEYQIIRPLILGTLIRQKMGPELSDSVNVKDIMYEYGTDRFNVYLIL